MNISRLFFNKQFFVLFLVLTITSNSFSQVGIGTIAPNSSSILDITSTTQGMLTPRMTTAERVLINNPAEGLLVFDTDLDSFYHFETTSSTWKEIQTEKTNRNNYKLIKSAADLSQELINGGGATYLLETNTLYEINGTILLTSPIDLNNAYIIGLDVNEDILVNAHGGATFSGSNGGSIRTLTLTAAVAGTGTLFALDDSVGDQTFVIQSSIVANMGSVGSIKGHNMVFTNIVQYSNNSNGMTFEDINNLLLNNQGWLGNNSGTYETFQGSFDLIEKVSGFSTVPAGATAINVSSNPSTVNGVIIGTVFSGAGTFVNKYTAGSYSGYNFTNSWTINCPGIPKEFDDDASGYLYFAAENSTVTNVTTDNVPVKMQGTTSTGNLFRMSNDSGTNNRLKYEGFKQRNFTVTCSATVERSSNGSRNVYSLIIYKNGSIVPSIISEQTFENGVSKANFTVLGTILLQANDYIEVYVSTDNKNIDPTVTRFNLVLY